MTPNRCLARALCSAVLLSSLTGVAIAQPLPTTVEKLLAYGWEIAGYIAAWVKRTLILFKHKEHRYLVQCSVLIDVMRNPRVVTSCNEIR